MPTSPLSLALNANFSLQSVIFPPPYLGLKGISHTSLVGHLPFFPALNISVVLNFNQFHICVGWARLRRRIEVQKRSKMEENGRIQGRLQKSLHRKTLQFDAPARRGTGKKRLIVRCLYESAWQQRSHATRRCSMQTQTQIRQIDQVSGSRVSVPRGVPQLNTTQDAAAHTHTARTR